jgi:hypothetical protein
MNIILGNTFRIFLNDVESSQIEPRTKIWWGWEILGTHLNLWNFHYISFTVIKAKKMFKSRSRILVKTLCKNILNWEKEIT